MNEIGKQIDVLLEEMKTVNIETAEQFEYAAEWLKRNKQTQKTVTDFYDPIKKELYIPYKKVLDEMNGFIKRLESAERSVKNALGKYQMEQERLRLEEQRKKEEEERRRIEELKLQTAINTGNDNILDMDVPTPKVIVQSDTPKISGVSFRETWDFEITDASLIPRDYLIPDEKKIRAIVQQLKTDTNIPGIKAVNHATVSARVF